MAVVFDAKQTTDRTGTATTSFTHTSANGVITVGSGSNRALIVFVQFSAVVSAVTATWDSGGTNQSMTQVTNNAASDNSSSSYIFGLVAPTSGQKTLSVSWTTSATFDCGQVSFTNVDQTGGATTFKNATFTQVATGPNSVVVTTVSGDMAVAGWSNNAGGWNTISAGTNIYIDNTNVSGAAAYLAAAGASTTLTATETVNAANVGVGCDITQFTSVVTPPPPPPSFTASPIPQVRSSVLIY